MEPQLGQKAKDKITGFTGIVTGVVHYISGCHQALLVPGCKPDGSLIDPGWFDLQRLEILDAGVVTLDNTETPGADAPAPMR